MQLVDTPVALPGCCFICRSENRPFFVDLQYNLDRDEHSGDFSGALYICSECLGHMASAANYSSPETTEKHLRLISDQDDLLTKYKTMVEGLEQAVDGLRVSRSVVGIDPGGPADLAVKDSGEQFPESAESVERREDSTPESNSGEGSDGVASNAGSDKSFSLDL